MARTRRRRHIGPIEPKRDRVGSPFADLYLYLLTAPWPVLFAILAGFFLALNLAFATGYYLDGGVLRARPGSFADMFFFSVQTMATIGYGRMAPVSLVANLLVAVEALSGLIGLAVVTGLVFAKFSMPNARVRFSRVAVVSERDGILSLMFRMANLRANRIVEAQVHVVLARQETTAEGEMLRRLYDLALVRERSALFALTWTAVHRIVAPSPMIGETQKSLADSRTEFIVSLTGLDETFSQTVHARHNYLSGDIIFGARLADILTVGADGTLDVDYSRFDDVIEVGSPGRQGGSAQVRSGGQGRPPH
jgi:inward rectifier potassium channel